MMVPSFGMQCKELSEAATYFQEKLFKFQQYIL